MLETGTILDKFSHKERAVLELLCEGYTDAKIAETLNCKVSTIEEDLHGIYSKLEDEGNLNFMGRSKRLSVVLLCLKAIGQLSDDVAMQ